RTGPVPRRMRSESDFADRLRGSVCPSPPSRVEDGAWDASIRGPLPREWGAMFLTRWLNRVPSGRSSSSSWLGKPKGRLGAGARLAVEQLEDRLPPGDAIAGFFLAPLTLPLQPGPRIPAGSPFSTSADTADSLANRAETVLAAAANRSREEIASVNRTIHQECEDGESSWRYPNLWADPFVCDPFLSAWECSPPFGNLAAPAHS